MPTIDKTYKSWGEGELSNSEFLNHLIRYYQLEHSSMFIDLWVQMLMEESKTADERLTKMGGE